MTIPPPPPPSPPIDDIEAIDSNNASRQRINRATVMRYANDYIENAVMTLGALMDDSKASTAQVRACEAIIAWTAGKPARYVDIGDLRGKTVFEAIDAVIEATARGDCSLEDGNALLDMLKKRVDLLEIEKVRNDLELLKAQQNGHREIGQG